MSRLLLLSLFSIVAVQARTHLPSHSVKEKSFDHVAHLRAKLADQSWWVQLGNTIFSPSLQTDRDLERESQGSTSVDSSAKNYFMFRGYPLPADLERMQVANENDYFILHNTKLSEQHGEWCDRLKGIATKLGQYCGDTQPLREGFMGMVPMAQIIDPQEQDLERDDKQPSLERLTKQATETSYMNEITKLASFGQRNVASIKNAKHQSIHEAADYIKAKFKAADLQVKYQAFEVPGEELDTGKATTTYNVIGCKEGASDKVIVVGAHYDSIPDPGGSGDTPSPGAMDNGSGVAATLETARIMKGVPLDATVYYVTFSAEEQGYFGSKAFVDSLDGGKFSNVGKNAAPITSKSLERGQSTFEGAIIMDMATGFKGKGSDGQDHPFTKDASRETILLDTEVGNAEGFLKSMAQRTATYTDNQISPVITMDPHTDWHTDHVSFMKKGYNAVYLCTKDHRKYPGWHKSFDKPEFIDPMLGTEIVRTITSTLGTYEVPAAALERGAPAKGSKCFSHFKNPTVLMDHERTSGKAKKVKHMVEKNDLERAEQTLVDDLLQYLQ